MHCHHLDGNCLNNDPENLILLTASIHAKVTHMQRKGLDVFHLLKPFFSYRSMCLRRMKMAEKQEVSA
jgi:hypothetical protein